MILDNEFDNDLRVKNEANSLSDSGHDVNVLCYNLGNTPTEKFNKIKLVRFSISKKKKDITRGLNNTLFNFYPHMWAKKIRQFIEDSNIDVLHVHDLWMMEAALLANRKYKLPIVLDLHENFVAALDHYKYVNTFPGTILISKKRWKKKEKEWMSKADEIIVVIEEAKKRVEKFDLNTDEISVVPNYVKINEFKKDDGELTETLSEKYKNNVVLTYTGYFDLHRGLEILVNAVPKIVEKVPNFKLLLVGNGSNFEDLKSLAKDLGVSEYIDFPGFLPHNQLPSYIKMSTYCIVPHLKTFHTDNTIPHKLFQYMLMEKPVLVSDCDPLKRIVEETKSGLVYSSRDSNDLFEKFISLISDGNSYGESGSSAVLDKYNWSYSASKLERVYDKIESKS